LVRWSSSYSSWGEKKALDFQALEGSDSCFRSDLRAFEAALPRLKKAFLRPVFLLPEASPESEIHPIVWMRTLTVAIQEYLRYLDHCDRQEQARELAQDFLLCTTNGTRAHDPANRVLWLVLQGWATRLFLEVCRPTRSWSSRVWMQCSDFLAELVPSESFLAEQLEDELALVARRAEAARKEARRRLIGRFLPHDDTWWREQYHSTAFFLQCVMEPPPRTLADVIVPGMHHGNLRQRLGGLADKCLTNRAMLMGAAEACRLLHHGKIVNLTVPVPPNRWGNERRRCDGTWFRYHDGAIHFELVDPAAHGFGDE
jgi:hypothetical protein